jgi:hypothetical protein
MHYKALLLLTCLFACTASADEKKDEEGAANGVLNKALPAMPLAGEKGLRHVLEGTDFWETVLFQNPSGAPIRKSDATNVIDVGNRLDALGPRNQLLFKTSDGKVAKLDLGPLSEQGKAMTLDEEILKFNKAGAKITAISSRPVLVDEAFKVTRRGAMFGALFLGGWELWKYFEDSDRAQMQAPSPRLNAALDHVMREEEAKAPASPPKPKQSQGK